MSILMYLHFDVIRNADARHSKIIEHGDHNNKHTHTHMYERNLSLNNV